MQTTASVGVKPSEVRAGDRLVTHYPDDAVVESWEVGVDGTVTAVVSGLLSGTRIYVHAAARRMACCQLLVPPNTVTYTEGECADGAHLLSDRAGFMVRIRPRSEGAELAGDG